MMRRELLALHRALVESERREYERTRGRVTDRAFLEALIGAPELAWLNPLTSLIVRLEEAVEENAAEPARGAAVADCVAEIRKLLQVRRGDAAQPRGGGGARPGGHRGRQGGILRE